MVLFFLNCLHCLGKFSGAYVVMADRALPEEEKAAANQSIQRMHKKVTQLELGYFVQIDGS